MRTFQPLEKTVSLNFGDRKITWGKADQWVLFAGPDIWEDEGMVMETSQELKRVTTALGIPWIFKCSFDKANRQSGKNYRGPGMDSALKGLEKVKAKLDVPLISDVHETTQVAAAAEIFDVIQIPAFLSRQTDLVVEAAKTGKVLHIKKGQFLAPWDMKSIIQKCEDVGNSNVLLCERGTTFGYNRLINDMTGLIEMRKLGKPVIMDATHSTQLPGAAQGGQASGGRREMVAPLARAALAVGVDGIFMETHPDPDKALCDGPTSFKLREVESFLKNLQAIWKTHQTEF